MQSISDLVWEKGGFTCSIGAASAASSERLHVRHGHAQDGELVWFACQSAAGGHHVRQLRDVSGHLIPPPALDLAVILPAVRRSWEMDGACNREEKRAGREKATTERERWMNNTSLHDKTNVYERSHESWKNKPRKEERDRRNSWNHVLDNDRLLASLWSINNLQHVQITQHFGLGLHVNRLKSSYKAKVTKPGWLITVQSTFCIWSTKYWIKCAIICLHFQQRNLKTE